MSQLEEFYPENLPSGTTPTVGGGFGEAIFIPSSGDTALTTDLTTSGGVGVWVGYIEAPPAFTKTTSSGLVTFPSNSDIGIISLGVDTTITHDLVITYKITDVGSDSTIACLPNGGTTLQVSIVDGADTIYQTSLSDPPQVDILALRKSNNDTPSSIIMLRGRIKHSNADTVRIKFCVVNGNVVNGVRINCFSINWQMNMA
jgi:hypothetical protein